MNASFEFFGGPTSAPKGSVREGADLVSGELTHVGHDQLDVWTWGLSDLRHAFLLICGLLLSCFGLFVFGWFNQAAKQSHPGP